MNGSRIRAALDRLPPDARLRQAVRIEEPSEACVPVDALLAKDRLAGLVAEHGAGKPDADPRAVASDWSKAWFRLLLPSVIVPALAGVALDASPGRCAVVLSGHLPRAFVPLAAAGEGQADSAVYGPLLRDHLAPMAARMRELTGLAPRVVWSNAGNFLAFLYREAAALPPLAEAARRHRAEILGSRSLPWLDGPNPLFEPVRLVRIAQPGGEREIHRRRVCCLRDRMGQRLCTSCPRLTDADLAALATAGAARPGD